MNGTEDVRCYCFTHGECFTVMMGTGTAPDLKRAWHEYPHTAACDYCMLTDNPSPMTHVDAIADRRPGLRWAIRMLFVWRWRLGYWDWQAFLAASGL